MRLLGVAYEHGNWSVGRDFERIRRYNPLGRVPTLVLDDGSVLMESSAILDYFDESVGPERALVPRSGRERRDCLQLMTLAIGAAESARDGIYEREFRPADKRHQPWLDRRLQQMHGGLAELETRVARRATAQWLVGERMTQADITLTCCQKLIADAVPLAPDAPYPLLRARAARCELLPEFAATKADWFAPSTQ